MKVALVCDDLVQYGGHEKIVMEFCKIFPDAPLYTTVASKKWQKRCKEKNIKLVTSFVQKLPFIEKLNRVYSVFLIHILGIESFNFDKFDLVISLSSRYAHGIITKPQTKHICYMSTVGRMFWEPNLYFKYENFGIFKSLAKTFLSLPLSYLRVWDNVASTRPDYYIANSVVTKNRIKKYYQKDSFIINPTLSVSDFYNAQAEDYFLVITRLVSWKRVDIAINACIDLGLKLKIVSVGPYENKLRELSNGHVNIEFLGYVSDKQKARLLSKCKALINTQYEDFGIVPLEALASGKPVIAYKKGGVLETIIDGKNGTFFEEQTSESLKKALESFDPKNYSVVDCIRSASKYDRKYFRKKVKEFINSVY